MATKIRINPHYPRIYFNFPDNIQRRYFALLMALRTQMGLLVYDRDYVRVPG